MSDDFGKNEYEARIADLAAFKRGEMTLDEVKSRAEGRRKAVGFRRGRATSEVSAHVRAVRRAKSATQSTKE